MKNLQHLFIICVIALASCDSPSNKPAGETTEATAANNQLASVWNYIEDEDKMTNEKHHYATASSTNELEFNFPYAGGSTFELGILNRGQGNNVKLAVSKGQFMPSIMNDKTVRVKFDDDKPVNYTYVMPSDGSSDVIFINNENKFIARLKAAKKLMIEAEFFQEGNQIIYFDVSGLAWEHK